MAGDPSFCERLGGAGAEDGAIRLLDEAHVRIADRVVVPVAKRVTSEAIPVDPALDTSPCHLSCCSSTTPPAALTLGCDGVRIPRLQALADVRREPKLLLLPGRLGCDAARRKQSRRCNVPIVHPCARPDCETLTMGRLCLEHEHQGEVTLHTRLARLLPRLTTASALVAAAAAGALIRSRLPR